MTLTEILAVICGSVIFTEMVIVEYFGILLGAI
jgi:hypothetical protein